MTGWAAGIARDRDRRRPARRRARFACSAARASGRRGSCACSARVLLAAVIGFGLYTAIKAAYLSCSFATRVEERNLIYIAPLLFVGTALLLDRRRVNVWALLGARRVFTAYLVGYAMYHPTQFPYEMNVQLYSDALGLAILQQANRYYLWTPEFARWRAARDRRRRHARARAAAAAPLAPRSPRALVGRRSRSASSAGRSPARSPPPPGATRSAAQPPTRFGTHSRWVDDATKGGPTHLHGRG